MSLSLYDASVLSYLQTIDALDALLEKSRLHLIEQGIDPEEIVAARLYPDMLPLGFQVAQCRFHSVAAIEAILSGELKMRERGPQLDYAGLQALVAETAQALRAVDAAALNARAGHDVLFRPQDREMHFTAEGFLTSFSLPNFHFHASIAYAILRSKGAPIGKRDFMGAVRLVEA